MRRPTRRSLPCALAVYGMLALGAQPALATYPGGNGSIAFVRSDATTSAIWAIEPDGTGERVLAAFPATAKLRFNVGLPSYSADGQTLAALVRQSVIGSGPAMTACGMVSGACAVVVLMDADGQHQRIVYAVPDVEIGSTSVALSPDARFVAITLVRRAGRERLFRLDVATGTVHRLTDLGPRGTTDVSASWSPDGRSIAFQSSREREPDAPWSVFTVSRTDKHPHPLAGGGNGVQPDWSPDGGHIAFLRTFAFPDTRVETVRVDGTDAQEVVHDLQAPQVVRWSPDRSALVLDENHTIRVVASTGGVPTPLTAGSLPAWQPRP